MRPCTGEAGFLIDRKGMFPINHLPRGGAVVIDATSLCWVGCVGVGVSRHIFGL